MDRPSQADASSVPLLLNITQACIKLGVSRWQLYQLINNGRLKTVRINRRRFVAPEDLTNLIEELRKEGGAYEN